MEAFKRVEAARAKGRPTGYDFISNMTFSRSDDLWCLFAFVIL